MSESHSRKPSHLNVNPTELAIHPTMSGTIPADSNSHPFLKLIPAYEDKGYKVLVERLRSGKHSIKKFYEYIVARIALETSYAANLTKMANALMSEDIGTTYQTLDVLKVESDVMAKNHTDFTLLLRNSIEKPLQELIAQQKTTREAHLNAAEKNMRRQTEAQQAYTRARDKMKNKATELSALHESLRNKYGKELEKSQIRITKIETQLKQLEQDHIQAQELYNLATKTWDIEWRRALIDLENLEMDRMDAIRAYVAKLVLAHKDVTEKDANACDRIRARADELDNVYDIHMYLSSLNLASIGGPVITNTNNTNTTTLDPSNSTIINQRNSFMNQSIEMPVPQPIPGYHDNPSIHSKQQSQLHSSSSGIIITDSNNHITSSSSFTNHKSMNINDGKDNISTIIDGPSPYPTVISGNFNNSSDVTTTGSLGLVNNNNNEINETNTMISFPAVMMDPRVPAPIDCVVIARFAYTAQIPEEISFGEGEELIVIARHPDGWWLAETTHDPREPGVRRRGLIPSNFVHIVQEGG